MVDVYQNPPTQGAADLGLIPLNMPADQARARIEALKADPEWVKRHVGGSIETKNELARLMEIAHAPAAGSITLGGPSQEAQLSDQASWAEMNFDVPPAVIQQIRERTPISQQEYRQTVARK